MNKYIIIFIILIIIMIYTYFIKNKSEYFGGESLINIFSPCKEVINGTVTFNNAIINGEIKFGGVQPKSLRQYMLDLLYPYGSFYVQYPNKNSNTDSEVFPIDKSPSKMFGGDWQEQWPEESTFFRTNGKAAKEDRVYGLQDSAIKSFTSNSVYFKSALEANGIFKSAQKESTLLFPLGSSVYNYNLGFDSANQSNTSELETRVRNRQIKVWKRVKRENNGSLPSLPANGFNTEYENIYFDGPNRNNTFVSPKDFNVFDKINTLSKAIKKCKEMGDECNAIGVSKNNVYKYSTTKDVNLNSDPTEIKNTYSIWFKKKNVDVL